VRDESKKGALDCARLGELVTRESHFVERRLHLLLTANDVASEALEILLLIGHLRLQELADSLHGDEVRRASRDLAR